MISMSSIDANKLSQRELLKHLVKNLTINPDYSYILNNSKILTNSEEIDFLNIAILKNKIFSSLKEYKFELIYRLSSNKDIDELQYAFHDRCYNIENTISLIQTNEDKIFGGFTTQTWDPDDIYDNDVLIHHGNQNDMNEKRKIYLKKDDKAFVFSLTNFKTYKIKNGCYAIDTSGNAPLFCGNKKYIIDISEDLKIGKTSKSEDSNFEDIEMDYELNDGQKIFKIKEIEVFELCKVD